MTTDETQPLLGSITANGIPRPGAIDVKDIVSFDPNGDSQNPRDWPKAYKWGIVALLALMAFTVSVHGLPLNPKTRMADQNDRTFTCISVVPIANHIVYDLDQTRSKSASVLLVTIWELGEAFGPLVLAPLSESIGRYPVFNAANFLFISATVLAVLCQSTPLFIVARALTGLAVASNVLNPAIVGDMFIEEERGSPMSAIMCAPLIGGAVGPAIAGAISETLGWRRVLWMAITLATVCEVVFLTCFRETYQVAILNQRVAVLRKETGNTALRTAFEIDNPEAEDKGPKKLKESILRPFVVFFDSGILVAMSVFGSLEFAYFYIMSTTLPDILENIYGLSPALTGSAFIAFSVGSILSVTFLNFSLDRIYIRLRMVNQDTNGNQGQPEYRLPLAIVGALVAPFVVALYGWCAQLKLPLPVMLFVLGFLGATMMLAFLPIMAYVVDAFGVYSASAMTALIVTRCLIGTFLPLGVGPLVTQLGYGWGFTVLCGVSLLTAPIPILVYRYGGRWRQKCRYTQQES
jgi:MFS family permease